MTYEVCCPKCSEVIVKSLSGQEIKVRSKVTIFKDDHCVAICKGCNTEVEIPLLLDMDKLHKSMSPTKMKSKVLLYLSPEFTDKKS